MIVEDPGVNSDLVVSWCQYFNALPDNIDVPSIVKADRQIALAAVLKDGALVRYLDDALKQDRVVVLAAVQQDAVSMRFVGHYFKGDREIVLAALHEERCFTLADADESLQCHRSFVLQAVKCNGRQLKYAKDNFQADRRFVSLAATSSPRRPEAGRNRHPLLGENPEASPRRPGACRNRRPLLGANPEACRNKEHVWSGQVREDRRSFWGQKPEA